MCTAIPPMSLSSSSHSPVWMPARISIPNVFGVSAHGLGAADGLRRAVEGDEVAVAGVLHHRAAETFRDVGGDLTKALQHRPPPLVTRRRGVLRRGDHVGEQHRAQGAM